MFFNKNELEKCIKEASEIEKEIKEKSAKLKKIKETILQEVCFEEGVKTAKLKTENWVVTIRQNTRIKWDFEGLAELERQIPETVNMLFKKEYKPKSSKLIYDLQSELRDKILSFEEKNESFPSFTFENIKTMY